MLPSHVSLTAPGNLTLDVSILSDVNMGTHDASVWVVDAHARGHLIVNQLTAAGVTIMGGGLLRAVADHVQLRNVNVTGLTVMRYEDGVRPPKIVFFTQSSQSSGRCGGAT